MLLPGGTLDTLLFRRALSLLIASRLLGALRLPVLILPLLLLGVLLPLLSMLLFRFGLLVLALFLCGVVLLFALLLVLCISRSSDSEKQGQKNCAGDSKSLHSLLPH